MVTARPARRIFSGGRIERDLIVQIAQRRYGYLNSEIQEQVDNGKKPWNAVELDFVFPGGCTIDFDMKRYKTRYIIKKDVNDTDRLDETRKFRGGAQYPTHLTPEPSP